MQISTTSSLSSCASRRSLANLSIAQKQPGDRRNCWRPSPSWTAAFAGHTMNTPWDLLHRGYFNGYARWTYLTTPFLMAMPGFEVTEIAPWQEGAERWRGLRARFPDLIASHSGEQDFYFGDDFLLRRHDYQLEIAGGIPVAQYVYDIVESDGFRFPAKRRVYVRGPHLKAIRDLLLISLDLSDFHELGSCPARPSHVPVLLGTQTDIWALGRGGDYLLALPVCRPVQWIGVHLGDEVRQGCFEADSDR
jgi:hypothetical protein